MYTIRQLRRLAALIVIAAPACSTEIPQGTSLADGDRRAIADSIRTLLEQTYVFDGTNPVPRFMKLYPDSGPVISAASGGFTTARDSVQSALTTFWTITGQNMQHPKWTWGAMKIDVLSRDAAVVTARYTIPHWTPAGRPHVLGGAWTTVWSNRGGRWMIVQEHLSDLPRAVAERVEATMSSVPPDTSK
jgi:hypothetical protein